MKKILFATTALLATASVAAADVTFSGYGRFGVRTTSTSATAAVAGETLTTSQSTTAATRDATTGVITAGTATALKKSGTAASAAQKFAARDEVLAAELALARAVTELDVAIKTAALADAVANSAAINGTAAVAKKTTTDITNRMEINVAASFEASNGVTYGGKMRVRSDGGAAVFSAPQFSATTGALSFVFGNNEGQMYHAGVTGSNVGLTGLGFKTYVVSDFDEYDSYGSGPQGIDVNYSAAGFSAGVSHSKSTKSTQVGVSYSAGALSLGAAMQDGTLKAADMNAVSVGYKLGGGNIDIAYGTNNGTKKTRVGGSFDVGAATSMTAFVLDTSKAGVKNTYGLGVSHDLGGAKLKAGYVKHDTGSAADFGIVFNF